MTRSHFVLVAAGLLSVAPMVACGGTEDGSVGGGAAAVEARKDAPYTVKVVGDGQAENDSVIVTQGTKAASLFVHQFGFKVGPTTYRGVRPGGVATSGASFAAVAIDLEGKREGTVGPAPAPGAATPRGDEAVFLISFEGETPRVVPVGGASSPLLLDDITALDVEKAQTLADGGVGPETLHLGAGKCDYRIDAQTGAVLTKGATCR